MSHCIGQYVQSLKFYDNNDVEYACHPKSSTYTQTVDFTKYKQFKKMKTKIRYFFVFLNIIFNLLFAW